MLGSRPLSLLKPSEPAHATPLKRFAACMRRKGDEERAVLQNLREEDRVPGDACAEFQRALSLSLGRLWVDRFKATSGVGARKLPVAVPRPTAITGTWWTHVPFSKLVQYRYVKTGLKGSIPPPKVRLERLFGRPEQAPDMSLWITNMTGDDADDIRNRLGLGHVMRGEWLFRIQVELTVSPTRPLFIPTALDAGYFPAWRRPPANHTEPWGMTRHLKTGKPCERELLALPDDNDASEGSCIGKVDTQPPKGHLRARGRR